MTSRAVSRAMSSSSSVGMTQAARRLSGVEMRPASPTSVRLPILIAGIDSAKTNVPTEIPTTAQRWSSAQAITRL